MLKPRDYQQKLIAETREAYSKGHKRVLAVLPTGGGKTVVFCYIAAQMAMRGKRVMILVHRIELLRQTYRAMKKTGVRTGLVNPMYTPDLKANVQVASVQTLRRRTGKYGKPDLLIIDEAHHSTAGSWKKIITDYDGCYIMGVTATPVRADGQGLGIHSGGVYDAMIEGPQVYELIDQGYLMKARVFRPNTRIELGGINIRSNGEYDLEQLALVLDKPTITGDAVQYYRKYADKQPAVAFCVNVAHAHHVAEQFRAAGYNAQAVDGTMDDDARSTILNGLANGSVHVVTSCDIISEGTDIPAIACAIFLRPTQSEGLYLQQAGRALRPIYAEGFDLDTIEGRFAAIAAGPKPNGAIILDHVGNTAIHGLPHWPRTWSLGGSIKRQKGKPKASTYTALQCPKCFYSYDPSDGPACPECGHLDKTKKRDGPTHKDGHLFEVDDTFDLTKAQQAADNKLLFALRGKARKLGFGEAWVQKRFAENRKILGDPVKLAAPQQLVASPQPVAAHLLEVIK